jgi:hypothetical protein
MTILEFKGNLGTALEGLSLPAGANVAIVAKEDKVLKRLRYRYKRGRLRKVKVKQASVTGFKTLVPRASAPLISREAFQPDARSLAILEGVRVAQEDLHQAGGAYDLDQVRTLMRGISRQAIDKRVQEGSLLAVPGPQNRRSYPTLQFDQDGTVVDGLKRVREALPTKSPWTVLNFLAQPDDRLSGRRPIDVLKQGNVDLVVEAARRFGEQGA